MDCNVIQHNILPPSTSTEPRIILPKKCSHCQENQLTCDFSFPCTSCISTGRSDNCTNHEAVQLSKPLPTTTMPTASKSKTITKRGYKSHVPSACVNCKTAHLACDVSRPCKRCISLKKQDTCQDMQHKKRGRPKLREKKIYSSKEHTFEILYGTIQTPAITSVNRNIIPDQQVAPFKAKIQKSTRPPAPPATISFIHESFQQPIVNDNTKDTVLPMVQLSASTGLINNITIILSMDVCCAKVSDDSIKCWGYYPQELAHRSFYDFISPKDSDRLSRLQRLLLDNVTNNNLNVTLPPTEPTTSILFSNADQQQLQKIAPGSRSFSDTIHIKKRSGEYELYEIVVYIGGGLGADLYNSSTFNKQYIVAQFKKHEYEVTNNSLDAICSPLLTPTSPINTPPMNTTPLLDLLKDQSLKSHNKFAQLSTSITTTIPKFNVAPTTTLPKHTTLPHQTNLFPRANPSVSRPPVSSMTPVTHPTQQYFLQTSSSTLNAAAASAHQATKPNSNDVSSVQSDRKMEMSIRSLLC